MPKIRMIDIRTTKIPSFSVDKGEYVVFRNLDTEAYQLNSGENNKGFAFDVGIIFTGEISSPVLFHTESGAAGFAYGCGLHHGLEGKIYVGALVPADTASHGPEDHHHMDLKHYHGFVTGGSTGEKIFMTHTPIFSDERHHFQIILQARFTEQRHIDAYNKLRSSSYGQGKFQVFFDKVALVDIQSGKLTELTTEPERGARFYPGGVGTVIPELLNATIKITKILHFRTFEPDMPYPEHLKYLLYGDEKDVFMDHFISRAPNFHSVAKLAAVPPFWKEEYYNTTLPLQVTSKQLIDVSPKTIRRVAFLDNRFHLLWGAPSGSIAPEDPLGPLMEGMPNNFPVQFENGLQDTITIGILLHFDATRLLNDGLGF